MSQLQKKDNSPFHQLQCIVWALSGLHKAQRALMRVIFLTPPTNSNAIFFQKHPADKWNDNILPAIWAFLNPLKLTHEINHFTFILILFHFQLLSPVNSFQPFLVNFSGLGGPNSIVNDVHVILKFLFIPHIPFTGYSFQDRTRVPYVPVACKNAS